MDAALIMAGAIRLDAVFVKVFSRQVPMRNDESGMPEGPEGRNPAL